MTRRELLLAGAATLLTAATRVVALARGPWDWDEILFLLALRDYDVALHHPHPPGFPLFILSAKGFVAMGLDPFRALQAVNLVASLAIVPAILFLCRQLGFGFRTSISAAVVFAFLPNVWFFGGSGFSDVAAIVLAVTACAFLLRGSRSARAFLAGALLLGIAAGFRPQNLLVGLAPAVIAGWSQMRQRRYGTIVAAAVIVTATVGFSYAGAVIATGDRDRYVGAVLAHQKYLTEVDSFLSDIRPSLVQVSDDFFVRPFRFPVVNVVLSLLALVSFVAALILRRKPVLIALAAFGPFWILAWLTLDFHSASRFSIGYMPLAAILAADGIDIVSRRRTWIVAAAVSTVTFVMAVWTWPGIAVARTRLSPPVQGVQFINQTVAQGTTIYVQKRLRPYAEYYLTRFPLVHLETDAPPRHDGVYLREGADASRGAVTFQWPREPLWNIARRRYFEVSVVPLSPP